ncbi:MAG: Transporter [Bacteroidetes bacterium]|nr:Transporter [Bacteroidota bacterium]
MINIVKPLSSILGFYFLLLNANFSTAQTLTLKDAVNKGLANYGTIKAKENYVKASSASLQQSKLDYIPNVVLSAQQDYGTINGQNGALYGFGGFSAASSGAALPEQNWNAAFGALYLANINWDFFTFGRTRERIKIVEKAVERDQDDLAQEQFQDQVRIAAAYLNLLAAQRITHSQEKNLERALVFKTNTVTRAKNGLIAGVDSSLANAEVSNARIALTRAKDQEQEQASKLAVLMGVPYGEFVLDTTFVSRIPKAILEATSIKEKSNPLLTYYQSRIDISNEQLKFYKRAYYPTLSMAAVFQQRASGFQSGYTQDQTLFSTDYGTGISPTRGNYLIGLGLNWNLTTIARNSAQVKSQRFITDALQNEYDLVNQQIKAQLDLADAKIKNALDNYNEAPIQVKAATDAYQQKTMLYKNGLTTITEVTQTLYALNRAETDRDIAYTNVWQALLLKVAAAGELTPFMSEF